VRAVLPHTALQSVVAQLQGLNVPGVGISQTSKPQIREVGIGPTECSRQTLRIAPVTFEQQTPQTSTDHSIVVVESISIALAKVWRRKKGQELFREGRQVSRLPISPILLLASPKPTLFVNILCFSKCVSLCNLRPYGFRVPFGCYDSIRFQTADLPS
jgi:hypothetical protein